MITSNIEEFRSNLKSSYPILGIDFGAKKIGIALSNNEKTFCFPLAVISTHLPELCQIVEKHKPCAIVIGLPVNMDGTICEAAKAVQKFATKVSELFKLPIFLQDERMTSRAASNLLKDLGMKRKTRDLVDDQVAAMMILETVLSGLKSTSSEIEK